MWKYIVTWFIVKTIIVECPEIIQYDEFGREIQRPYVTMEGCYKNDSLFKEKVFDEKNEALKFIERGKKDQIRSPFGPHLVNFILDSIPAIQYTCKHPYGSSTSLGCYDTPCNTFTCGVCGKKWSVY